MREDSRRRTKGPKETQRYFNNQHTHSKVFAKTFSLYSAASNTVHFSREQNHIITLWKHKLLARESSTYHTFHWWCRKSFHRSGLNAGHSRRKADRRKHQKLVPWTSPLVQDDVPSSGNKLLIWRITTMSNSDLPRHILIALQSSDRLPATNDQNVTNIFGNANLVQNSVRVNYVQYPERDVECNFPPAIIFAHTWWSKNILEIFDQPTGMLSQCNMTLIIALYIQRCYGLQEQIRQKDSQSNRHNPMERTTVWSCSCQKHNQSKTWGEESQKREE